MAYRLKLPQNPTWHRKHDVFNEKILKPFIKPSFEIHDPPALPDLVEEEEEYEVEAILNSRKKGQYIEYLVKWKGYSDAKNSWEPRENVHHAKEEVENFHKQYPSKPKPTSSNYHLKPHNPRLFQTNVRIHHTIMETMILKGG